ncbi:hypothetical protein WM23_18250, partial [Burkholderia ubonensis]
MPVVMQPRLVIMVLPLEPDRVPCFMAFRLRLPDRLLRAPRPVPAQPHHFPRLVQQFLRRPQMIVLIKQRRMPRLRRHLHEPAIRPRRYERRLHQRLVQPCQRHERAGFVQIER